MGRWDQSALLLPPVLCLLSRLYITGTRKNPQEGSPLPTSHPLFFRKG